MKLIEYKDTTFTCIKMIDEVAYLQEICYYTHKVIKSEKMNDVIERLIDEI